MTTKTILIVTTQTWLQSARLALRFAGYGADVQAVCPPDNQLAHSKSVSAVYPFWTLNPLASLHAAFEKAVPDYVIPGDDRAVWFLHELGRRYPVYRELIERSIGPESSYDILRSRPKLLQLAQDLDITTPATALIGSVEDLQEWKSKVPGPFFLKKDGTFGGGGVRRVDSADDAEACYQDLLLRAGMWDKLRQRFKGRDATVFASFDHVGEAEVSAQAFVDGVAANAMFACHEGKILGGVQARVVAAKGETGAALMIELIDDERITRAGALLAASLQMTGFFGLDYILDAATGEPYLIEMNPRCTQLGHVAVANQQDLAGMLWSQWTSTPIADRGSADLGRLVAFFPQAGEWDPNSAFLKQSRFDVCADNFDAVARLCQRELSLVDKLRRRTHFLLKHLRSVRQLPPTGPRIFYFNEEYAGPPASESDAQRTVESDREVIDSRYPASQGHRSGLAFHT